MTLILCITSICESTAETIVVVAVVVLSIVILSIVVLTISILTVVVAIVVLAVVVIVITAAATVVVSPTKEEPQMFKHFNVCKNDKFLHVPNKQLQTVSGPGKR